MRKIYCLLILVFCLSCKNEPKNIELSGLAFGTSYKIKYFSDTQISYQNEIDSVFTVINNSLSTYQQDSDISKFNRNEPVEVDAHFKTVFKASKQIFRETHGVFDPTIGNVVNAWNFGPDKNKFLTDSSTIKSLMTHVGFNKIINTPKQLIKQDKNSYLDFNAIAKGYGIDVIGNFLKSQGVKNFIIEIGGDLVVYGRNIEKQKLWTVGVSDPNFDGSHSYKKVIPLFNKGMATSGTYRKFKVDEKGNRYAHIINAKTGYPTKTNVLSVSVIAPNCMLADGYATAFQAMGIEQTTSFLKTHPELQVYFIYLSETNTLNTLSLNNFPE